MNKFNAQTIIRQLDPNVWIFSTPFFRYSLVPFGGRSTAITLKSGGVWVLASTPLNDNTKSKLTELGSIKYIMAPDVLHHIYLKDYKAAYPDAKLIGVAGHIEKYKGSDLKFDGAYGHDPEGTKYGFEDEIEAVYFSSHASQDVAFFHKDSKSLIEADLLFNLPAKEQHSKTGWSFQSLFSWISLSPYGGFHKRVVKTFAKDQVSFKKSVNEVVKWDITRIIPCHGDVIESEGSKAWKEAYTHYID